MKDDGEAEYGKIVMEGNAEMHGDAYIIFRVFADTIKNEQKESLSKDSETDTN